MTSVADALYNHAQWALRTSINERASLLGWNLRWVSSVGWAPRWVGDDRWRNDQYEVLYDSIWDLAKTNPEGVEAEAVEWLRRNSNDTYRRMKEGVPDTVPLTPR